MPIKFDNITNISLHTYLYPIDHKALLGFEFLGLRAFKMKWKFGFGFYVP